MGPNLMGWVCLVWLVLALWGRFRAAHKPGKVVWIGGWYQRWYLPSPFRFNVDTQHKTSRSGAHPNQMKQLRMILKAQEVYFALNTLTVNKYEDGMTNGGQ